MQKIYYILGIIISFAVIVTGSLNVAFMVDAKYAHSDEFCDLRADHIEKKLRDEIFQLKLLLVQENIYSGNQETMSVVWMTEQLKVKELKLKKLIERRVN